MKLTDKRIWKFEAAMLLCGVATVCVEALNNSAVDGAAHVCDFRKRRNAYAFFLQALS